MSNAGGRGSVATREPQAKAPAADTPDPEQPAMLTGEPMTVASRGRLYTTEDQRRRLGLDRVGYGRGTDVSVAVAAVDRVSSSLAFVETAIFETTIATDGVIRIPSQVRERCELDNGDDVRVSIRVINE